jgi:hypothetical protein
MLIDHPGRADLGTGALLNRSAGGAGCGGRSPATEHERKAKFRNRFGRDLDVARDLASATGNPEFRFVFSAGQRRKGLEC